MHYPFRSTSMLMFGHLVRKTQANDLNDDLEFSRSCRKLLNGIIIVCYRCQKRSSSISMTLSISRTKKVSI